MSGTCIAVLGLGEAGAAIGLDLAAAGAVVRGYDPVAPIPDGVVECASEADAVTGAGLVLSLTTAQDAPVAQRAGAPALAPGAVWADLNTGSAGLKERLASELAATVPHGVFADVALMSPVPGLGVRTPMLASGDGAAPYAQLLTPLGARVETLAGPPGAAATRKLLRSVFYKGMSAAVVEALAAARAAGLEEWLREEITAEFVRAGAGTMERMERGSFQHAVRRSHEMAAAAELLEELGVTPRLATASRDLLAELAESGGEHP
jgi:3-hydroxyisobutyrate dehydrogenase-like beta-hydroxyacid dehydrogenase